jgi:hypothetical protein
MKRAVLWIILAVVLAGILLAILIYSATLEA